MADKSPAFQFYPKDFLTDPKQLRMPLAAVGAYVRLMAYCWLEGSLPDDTRELARLCGATASQMKDLWPALAPCFVKQEGGALTHPRLDKEREKQARYRHRASLGGITKAARKQDVSSQEADDKQCLNDALLSSSSSPISSLQTAVVEARAPVALAGTLPRDHIRHAWCSDRGKCVPDFLHEQFKASIGGEARAADRRLKAFYEAVQAGWPPGPIGDDPVKLWRQEFAAKFPSVAPVKNGSADLVAKAVERLARDEARYGKR